MINNVLRRFGSSWLRQGITPKRCHSRDISHEIPIYSPGFAMYIGADKSGSTVPC